MPGKQIQTLWKQYVTYQLFVDYEAALDSFVKDLVFVVSRIMLSNSYSTVKIESYDSDLIEKALLSINVIAQVTLAFGWMH